MVRFASYYGYVRPLGYSTAIYWLQAGFLLAASLPAMAKPYQPEDRFAACGLGLLLTVGLLSSTCILAQLPSSPSSSRPSSTWGLSFSTMTKTICSSGRLCWPHPS